MPESRRSDEFSRIFERTIVCIERDLGKMVIVLISMLLILGCSTQTSPKQVVVYPPIQMYVREGCRHCASLEKFLSARGIPYQRLVINRDRQAYRRFLQLGFVGVPTTIIRSEIIRGDDPQLVLETLERYQSKVARPRQ